MEAYKSSELGMRVRFPLSLLYQQKIYTLDFGSDWLSILIVCRCDWVRSKVLALRARDASVSGGSNPPIGVLPWWLSGQRWLTGNRLFVVAHRFRSCSRRLYLCDSTTASALGCRPRDGGSIPSPEIWLYYNKPRLLFIVIIIS